MKETKKNNFPQIIFEDESFVVLVKPAGWIVNRATTTKGQPILQDWITENFKYEISSSEEFRSGIVHRLDKETSGLILVAKTKETFQALQALFKERKVTKTYLALVHGKVEPGVGKINAPVGRLPWRRDRFGVLAGGRSAETDYKVRKYFQKDKEIYSLVEARPKTGRTHQIRIHFKYLGHPIVADGFYAGRKRARKDRGWCPRLFLHAEKIAFKHPKTGKKVSFEAPLTLDLREALYTLFTIS